MAIEDKNTPKSEETKKLEEGLEQTKKALSDLRSKDEAGDQAILRLSIKKERQEKIDTVFTQLELNIKSIKEKESRLAELAELRVKLAIQEAEEQEAVVQQNLETQRTGDQEEKVVGDKNLDNTTDIETKKEYKDMSSQELDEEYQKLWKEKSKKKVWNIKGILDKDKELEGLKKLFEEKVILENAPTMEEKREVFARNQTRILELDEKLAEWVKELAVNGPWKFVANKKLNKNISKAEKEENILRLENSLLEEDFEKVGREKFPLAYFAADKIEDPIVKEFFTGYGLRVKKGEDRHYTSLNKINNIASANEPIENPLDRAEFGPLRPSIHSDNIVHLNLYGFSIRMTNRDEVELDENDNFDIDSPDPRYKIVGPDGRMVMENVDYNNATRIYDEATERYKKLVESQFNSLKNK